MININPQILKEIKTKKEILEQRERNFFYQLLGRRHLKTLQESALVHSFKMEYSESSLNSYTCHPKRKLLKKGTRNLEEAYAWANSNYSVENLDEGYIKRLAGMINQETFENRVEEYRGMFEQVRIPSASWTPPYSEKIPQEMEAFLKKLNEMLSKEDLDLTIEGSCYANFQLIRIHPFNDGNGRTSRIIQNLILRNAGLPPVDISPGERFAYYKLLDSAVHGYRFNSGSNGIVSPQERELYNYLAGKVSSSLDLMLDKTLG